jgi:hypothetical protein
LVALSVPITRLVKFKASVVSVHSWSIIFCHFSVSAIGDSSKIPAISETSGANYMNYFKTLKPVVIQLIYILKQSDRLNFDVLSKGFAWKYVE